MMHEVNKAFNTRIVFIILLIIGLNFQYSKAQLDSSLTKRIEVTAYLEPYYSYDFSNPDNHYKPSFIYAYNRHNEVNLNLGFVKASYARDKIRANLALMTGTYSNANLVAEPGVLKNIYEANGGIRLSNIKSIWVDAGILPSHIGFESAVGKECWNLTRSILADNSPYFESGVKVSYHSENDQLLMSALILNGWQRIHRIDGNQTPSFGHQLLYRPNPRLTLNSSSFIGSDTPDTARLMRYFHNFYGIVQPTEKFGITVGFDIGGQQKQKGSGDLNIWYSPVVILRLSPSEKINLAGRVEFYSDENEVIIALDNSQGFKTFSYSMNLDLNITPNAMLRIEGRGFQSEYNIFSGQSYNYQVSSSFAMSF